MGPREVGVGVLDLLILGAGPAGCAAAIHARRAGLGVMILEAAGRARPVPGETLHPGIEPIFAKLGVHEAVLAAGFHRHRGVWIEWDQPRQFETYGEDDAGPWHGFQADRRQLNDILLQAAIDLGAELQRPAKPEAVLGDGRRVRGVVVNGRELRARWTADATGSGGWLADRLGQRRHICSPPMHAQFGWSDDGDRDGQPGIKAHFCGWDWHAPLGNGKAAWVSLRIDDPSAHAKPRLGTDVTWRTHTACAGAGYFLLGDAAAILDPSSSHGVLRAIMSGMWCAHAIAGWRRKSVSMTAAAGSYRQFIHGQFEHDVEAMRALYRRHPAATLAALFSNPAPVHGEFLITPRSASGTDRSNGAAA
jgi:flavin-dependent dehydrogenase